MDDEGQSSPPQEGSGPSESGTEGSGGAAEISRRVAAILDAVEREAQKQREEARAEAAAYLERATRTADELVADRKRRISELSDELVRKTEAVVSRLDDAAPVQQGFESLVRALGYAAQRLSDEALSRPTGVQPSSARHVPGPQPPPYAPARPFEAAPQPPPRFPEPPPAGPADHLSYGTEAAQPGPGPQSHPARAPSTPGRQTPLPPGREAGGRAEVDDPRTVATRLAATGATRAEVRDHLHRALGMADATAILDEIFGAGTGSDALAPWSARPR